MLSAVHLVNMPTFSKYNLIPEVYCAAKANIVYALICHIYNTTPYDFHSCKIFNILK